MYIRGLSFIGKKKEVQTLVQKFLLSGSMCGFHKEGKAGISGETALCPGMIATARGSHVKL